MFHTTRQIRLLSTNATKTALTGLFPACLGIHSKALANNQFPSPTTSTTTTTGTAPLTASLFRSKFRTFSSARDDSEEPLLAPNQEKKLYNVPTIRTASELPLHVSEMDSRTLVTLAALGKHDACQEIVIRNIMACDQVDYETAQNVFALIKAKNEEFKFLLGLPYKIGIIVALSAGFSSFFLVFDLNTAHWFNTQYVTTSIPEPHDLETVLEVGAWTWNWMEPPLGQISFFLLCLQYSRQQLNNLGLRPYTGWVKQWRGKRLAKAFPRYDSDALISYSKATKIFLFYEKKEKNKL